MLKLKTTFTFLALLANIFGLIATQRVINLRKFYNSRINEQMRLHTEQANRKTNNN